MTDFATTRLALRPAAAADGDDMYALEQDPEVMRFLSGGVPVASRVPDPTAGFLMPRGGEPGIWVARMRAGGSFVGWFSLRPRGDDTAELGYRLKRALWGQGYAVEGASALVDLGFSRLGFKRIVATTMAANRGSRRVMEKAGLVYISSFPYGGPETSPDPADWDVEYALTVSDWAAGKTASGTASH